MSREMLMLLGVALIIATVGAAKKNEASENIQDNNILGKIQNDIRELETTLLKFDMQDNLGKCSGGQLKCGRSKICVGFEGNRIYCYGSAAGCLHNVNDCSTDADCNKYSSRSLKFTDRGEHGCSAGSGLKTPDPNTWRVDACRCRGNGNGQWTQISPGCVESHNIKTYTGKTVEECKQLCVQESGCVAVEVYADHGVDGTVVGTWQEAGRCQLQDSASYQSCETNAQNNNIDLYIAPVCEPISGPGKGQPCIFPFKFNSKICEGPDCCNVNDDSSGSWCSTKVDRRGNHIRGHYGYCSGSCSGGIGKCDAAAGGCCEAAADCHNGVKMKCGGKYICTKIFNEHNLISEGFGTYIEGTHTCDYLRRQAPVTFKDYTNTEWRVEFGKHIQSMCFPGGNEMFFHAGTLKERQGYDHATQYLCCSFMKVQGGAHRDDSTRICCRAFVAGAKGTVNLSPDHFGNFIRLLNAGAPYYEAYTNAAAAVAPALVGLGKRDMMETVDIPEAVLRDGQD